jgi:hypothetical protein
VDLHDEERSPWRSGIAAVGGDCFEADCWLVDQCGKYLFIVLVRLHGIPTGLRVDVPINLGAIFYIVLFNVLFASSVVFFNWDAALHANRNKVSAHAAFGSRFLVQVLLVSSVLTILCSFQGMRLQGVEFNGNIFEFAGSYAALRYANALTGEHLLEAWVLLNFFVIVLGGLVWGAARGGRLRGSCYARPLPPCCC